MSLLPGLRELRAPLVSGYLWLVTACLWLGNLGWLPTRRPSGSGEVARLWDLGGVLGTTVVLTAVTFVAYLIGSFLEFQPDGRVARNLTPLMLAGRTVEYQLKGNQKREQSFNRAVVSVYGSEEYAGLAEAVALKVAQSAVRTTEQETERRPQPTTEIRNS